MRPGLVSLDNVNDFGPLRFQVIRDEASMAAPPDRFCTHDHARTMPFYHFLQARYAFGELRRFHVIGVTTE